MRENAPHKSKEDNYDLGVSSRVLGNVDLRTALDDIARQNCSLPGFSSDRTR